MNELTELTWNENEPLDLSYYPNLIYLAINHNQFNYPLDLKQCPFLKELYILSQEFNQPLTLRKTSPRLEVLTIGYKRGAFSYELDVSNLPLKRIRIESSLFQTLHCINMNQLIQLELTLSGPFLDIKHTPLLESLILAYNYKEKITLGKVSHFKSLVIQGKKYPYRLDTILPPSIETLEIASGYPFDLNLTKYKKLKEIDMNDNIHNRILHNKLKEIDIYYDGLYDKVQDGIEKMPVKKRNPKTPNANSVSEKA